MLGKIRLLPMVVVLYLSREHPHIRVPGKGERRLGWGTVLLGGTRWVDHGRHRYAVSSIEVALRRDGAVRADDGLVGDSPGGVVAARASGRLCDLLRAPRELLKNIQ